MKAVINGHEVEGTPDEVAALMMIMTAETTATVETAAAIEEYNQDLIDMVREAYDKRGIEFKKEYVPVNLIREGLRAKGIDVPDAIKPNDQFTHTYPFSKVTQQDSHAKYWEEQAKGMVEFVGDMKKDREPKTEAEAMDSAKRKYLYEV